MSADTAAELSKLLDELDDESLAKLDDAEVLKMRKKLNPYGQTIEGSGNILTFSYTDLQSKYQQKLITTSIIGFLNRMCDEWEVPTGVPVIPVYDYVKDPKEHLNEVDEVKVMLFEIDKQNRVNLSIKRAKEGSETKEVKE